MFCGTRSFFQVHDDPPPSKLKRSFSTNHKKSKNPIDNINNNPYSSMGLDKFEKTLSVLEVRREKIMKRSKSQGDDALVRFMYKPECQDWIPIIIKQREHKEERSPKARLRPSLKVGDNEEKLKVIEEYHRKVVNKSSSTKDECTWRRQGRGSDHCYWALGIVLILVLLIFGRSFAICWTAVWWYLVPLMKGESKNLGKGQEVMRI